MDVPNWILAKPREALIEQIRAQLQTDWQSEAVAFAAYLVNNPACRAIITKDNDSDRETGVELSPEDLPYVYIMDPPFSASSTGFYDAAGEEMQFR